MQSLLFTIGPLVVSPPVGGSPPELDPTQHGLELSDELTLTRFEPGGPYDHFGHQLYVLPDIDGDEVQELAIASRPWVGGLTNGIGHVSVVSGRTWEEQYRIVGEEHEDRLWGEGIATDTLGQVLVVGPDEDDDGHRDLFLLGGDEWASERYQRVVSAATGETLRRVKTDANDLVVVENAAGDVESVRRLPEHGGRRPFRGWSAPDGGQTYLTVHEVDIDGDGRDDPIEVALLPLRRPSSWPLQEKAMTLFVGDGSHGTLRWKRRLEMPGGGRVARVGPVGDLDGDGAVDLGVGLVDGARGLLTLHSGADGHVLATATAPKRWSFGAPVVSLGDVHGDGSVVLVVGDHENTMTDCCAGAVFALSYRPATDTAEDPAVDGR